MAPRTRSTTEMRFFVSLQTCPQCGTRIDPEWLALWGDGQAWALTGDCGRCRTPLAFTFVTRGNPIIAPVQRGELGGPEHSEVISVGALLAEIDRLVPLVHANPKSLALDEWIASRDANARLRTCLAELAKFVPPRESAIPDFILSEAERGDRAQRPERYQLAWIDEMRGRHDALLAEIVADLPRIDELQRRARPPKLSSGELDRDALRAHEAWVKRGQRTGDKGRLVLIGILATGERIGAAELSGAKLDDVDFTEVDLSYALLVGAELTGACLARANLTSVSMHDAKIHGAIFDGAAMALAKFERAVVKGASFAGADLDRSQWQSAQATDTTFDGTRFGNAALDDATFAGCSFHRVDFSPTTARPAATTRRARFEQCDLRSTRWEGRDLSGAIFVRCKMNGLAGHPSTVDGVVVEDPDLSVGGDCSLVGGAADVLEMWR